MASSRIFVRNLPPKLSENDFQRHFSGHAAVTDTKLFPHRRIGYVGYKTPEDAEKAAKYFNKTFIRMSRIGVEVARPYTESTDPPSQPTENALKRKRNPPDPTPENPKLQEFLEVMLPAGKRSKPGKEEVVPAPAATASNPSVEAPGDDSDEEYQTLDRRSNRLVAQEPTPPTDPDGNREPGQEDGTTAAVTDDDWLRSRTTSKILDEDAQEVGDEEEEEEEEWQGIEDDAEESGALHQNADETQATNHDRDTSDAAAPTGQSDADLVRSTGRLFIRNLPYSATADELEHSFAAYGATQEVHVPIDSNSGKSKGFAYVQFADPEDAVKAIEALDGSIFEGRLMHVLPAAAKRESKLDEFALSKLPHKKQQQILRKSQASSTTFNWNSLYMNADAVMSSVSDRLGVSKSDVLDPTSADAAVKQAQAETHIIQETKSYFASNGVDLDAFKKRQRGDVAILVKNFPYGTTPEELKTMFEAHGQVKRLLMPPSGVIAIVEFAQPNHAKAAFGSLAYRKIKDSILFLEKAPRDLFSKSTINNKASTLTSSKSDAAPVSTSELLRPDPAETVDTSTLFVRNLNFDTTSSRLVDTFSALSGFMSATVKTKPNPKKPGETLSMGFGFLEFRSKEDAQAAVAAMDGYSLDGHKLQIRASQKTMDLAEERRKEDKAKKAASRKTKIVIKNLPFQASKKDIRSLFGSYGQLRSVRVPKKFDGTARGFAFADFTTPREAENAMDALRNTHFLGRRLVLDFVEEDPADAEEEIERMQKKVGSQVNKVALQRLTGAGRKKFNVDGDPDDLAGET